jgi:hypothetical protein
MLALSADHCQCYIVQFESKRSLGDGTAHNVSKEKRAIWLEQGSVAIHSGRENGWLRSSTCASAGAAGTVQRRYGIPVGALGNGSVVTTNLKAVPWYWYPR